MPHQSGAEAVVDVDHGLAQLIEKQAIREVLTAGCRAVDRLDRDLAETVWHEHARIEFPGMLKGDREAYLQWLFAGSRGFQSSHHQLTNVTTKVAGDKAVSEAYVTARLQALPGESGRRTDLVIAGRYLDRWTKRASGWMIDERLFLTDHTTQIEVAGAPADTAADRPAADGGSAPDQTGNDPSYALLASIA
jgi:hypothetical protein